MCVEVTLLCLVYVRRYTGDFRGERGKWVPADKVRLLERDEWAYVSELVSVHVGLYSCLVVVWATGTNS